MLKGRMLGDRARQSHIDISETVKWMTKIEQAEAIPPIYSRFMGEQLMCNLNQQVATVGVRGEDKYRS
jgi:hypothetical protein